jgi:predicted RNase H-like HicB family nuclease
MKYLIVVEETATGYFAYSPDLPGCVATGRTRAEVAKMIEDAIAFHGEGMHAKQREFPTPHRYS